MVDVKLTGGLLSAGEIISLMVCLLAVMPTMQAKENDFNVYTPMGDVSYDHTWLLTDQPSILFQMQTCHGGSLLISQTPREVSQNAYKIIINKDNIQFIRASNGTVLKSRETPDDHLKCHDYSQMWLSWVDGKIWLGVGGFVGEDDLLDYDDSANGVLITGLSFAASNLSDVSWKLARKHVQTAFIDTSKETTNRRFNMTDNEGKHFVFGVRSCLSATLILSEESTSIVQGYTIKLSAWGISSINFGKMSLARAETPGLLHCDVTRWIWVRWVEGFIEVGQGMSVGDEMIMKTSKTVDTKNLVQIGINGMSEQASYQIRNFEVNSFRLLAVANLAESRAYRLHVASWYSFIFRVRACQDATIQLKRNPSNIGLSPPFVRITIGAEGNTRTDIDYLNADGGMLTRDSQPSDGVLSCNEMRLLWLSWKNETFRLGRGEVVFKEEIFHASDKHPPNVPEWLQLISQDEVDLIDWQFDHNQGAALVIPTPLGAGFLSEASYTVSGIMSLVFKVKGQYGARLSLGRYLAYNVGNTYQVVLGLQKDDITYSELFKSGDQNSGVSVKTPDVISDTRWQYFWVGWYGGHVEVGRGSVVGEGGFMSLPTDKEYEVNAVHMTGDSKVVWMFNSIEVDRYSIHTRAEGTIDSYSNVWVSTHLNLFPFMVKAGFSVSVVLTKTPGKASDGDVEIFYGVEDNTATVVMIRGDESSRKQISTDNIISDSEFRPLWIIFYNRTVRLGAGDIWGKNFLLTYETPKPIEATGVILNNARSTPAEWSILPETVNVVRKKTPAIYGHRQLWRSVNTGSVFTFRVKAKSNAHILLSPAISQTDTDVIEVTIGYDNNTMISIKNGTKDSPGDVLKSVKLPYILNENYFRDLWLSWESGEIQLGHGTAPRRGEYAVLIDYTLLNPIPFRAVSVCTSKTTGDWEISEVVRDMYYLSTPPMEGPAKFSFANIYTAKTFLQFGVVSCTSARILLYGGILPEASTFEIVIGENITDTAFLYSVTFNGDSQVELARSTAPGVFRCGVEHIYWLSWEDKLLQMGIGNYPEKILFEYTHSAEISFDFLSLGSGTDGLPTPTHWQLRPNSVGRLQYSSTGPKNYDQFYIASTAYDHVRFNIEAEGDVAIVLSETPKVTTLNAVELLIQKQDDKHQLIVNLDGELQKNVTVKNLDLSKGGTFWISWRYGTLGFGHGAQVGSGRLISHPYGAISIGFIAVSSLDQSTSKWGILNGQGSLVEFHSPATDINAESYNRVWFAPANGMTTASFQVQACKNARIALAHNPGVFSQDTYEVLLEYTDETTGSTTSSLRAGVGGIGMDSVTELGVVACNEVKDFWVDWYRGISVGKGQYRGHEFLHYSTLPFWTFKPNVLAFATGPDSDGDWAFPLEQAEVVFVDISGDPGSLFVRDNFWIGVPDRTSIVFTVKLEKHAIVLVSELAFQGKDYAYEFEIQRNDSYTVLRQKTGGKELEKVLLPNILSKDEPRAFWLSWDNHTLALGQGALLYQRTLISHSVYDEMDGHSFASVGVAKGLYKGGGQYSFLRSRGKVYQVFTKEKDSYGKTFLISERQVVTFQVKACNAISVLLVAGIEEMFRDTVEIIIGAYYSKIVIRYFSKNEPVAEIDVGNFVLDCYQRQSFWVSWSEGVIRVGSGSDLTRDMLSWVFRDPDTGKPMPFKINAFTVGSVYDAEWEIDFYTPRMAKIQEASTDKQDGGDDGKSDTDETFVALTDKDYKYDQHWVGVPGDKSFVFMVMAGKDVHLALAAIPLNVNTMAYEIGIGTSANRKSIIRPRPGTLVTPVRTAETPNILDSGSFRAFWVSWYGGEVAVGTGRVVGKDPFLQWSPDTPIHVVNSIGLATGGGTEGVWYIGNLDRVPSFTPADDKYLIQTPDNEKYHTTFIAANDFLMFGVQACSDALLKINAIPSDDQSKTAFIVAIGTKGNTKSSITQTDSTLKQEEETPSVLHCNATRSFWVTWRGRTISLGLGRNPVGEDALVSLYQADMPDMHSVSISTDAVTGNWEISRSQTFYCQTMSQPPGVPTFEEFWVSIQMAKELVFSIEACSEAQIYFTSEKQQAKNSYYVQIGSYSNTKSSISEHGLTGEILDEVTTVGILSCTEMRYFWARWYQGLVLGRGRVPGAGQFIHTSIVHPVASVGFSGYFGTPASFRFQDINDDSIYALTPGDNSYQHVWVSTSRTAFTFKVKSCSGAVIRLGPSMLDDDPGKPAYEVILENGATQIRRFPGPEQMKNATTPELVTCHLFTELTLSWADGYLELLQGRKKVISAVDKWPFPVKALTFGAINYGRYGAEWKFPRHLGRDTIIITPDSQTDYTKWLTTSGDSLVFRLRVESDAILQLCQYVATAVFDCYQVVIQERNEGSGTCLTYLKTYAGGETVKSIDGCGFVSSTKSAQFWVSWKDSLIMLGVGSQVGYHEILSWDASGTEFKHPVNAISMLTYKHNGYWEFSQIEDRYFEVKTPERANNTVYFYPWLRMADNFLSFRLKGCKEAVVLLAERPNDRDSPRYEILMGEKSHTFKVQEDGTKVIMGQYDTPGLLDCDNYKEFYLTWSLPYTNLQSIVLKEVIGDNTIELEDEEGFSRFKVHAVSFAGGPANSAMWMFKDDAAAVTSLETPGDKDTEQIVYKLSHSTFFIFKLRGKGPAHVVLQEHYHTDNVYEFTIGAADNMKTAVKSAKSNKYDKIVDTPNILSEVDLRQFWITWSDSQVAIGQGLVPGVGEILHHKDNDLAKISMQYIALTTSLDNNGTWEVTPHMPDEILANLWGVTGSNPEVTYLLTDGQEGALFWVRTCETFTISLHSGPNDPSAYKVEYKTRALSVYRHNTKVHSVTLKEDLQSCSTWAVYWVGWKDGYIELDVASQQGRRVIWWQDEEPLAVHVLKVPNDGQVSQWSFSRYLGSGVRVRQPEVTTGVHAYFRNLWYSLSGRHSLIFAMKAEDSGSVLFTRTPGVSTHDGYELIINNLSTKLYRRLDGQLLESEESANTVSSVEFRDFWCTWDKGLFRFGKGVLIGVGQILSHQLEPGYDVVAASFDDDELVEWSFTQDSGNEMVVNTMEKMTFDPAWFAPKGDTFTFSVMAGENAVVRLFNQPEYKEPYYIDLAFGSGDNTAFYMLENGNVKKTVESKGLLNVNNYRTFWVDLGGGRIRVGEGPYLEEEFLNEQLTWDISSISLGHDSKEPTSWKIPQDQEYMARFRTPGDGQFGTHWITLVGYNHAIFRVKACKSVRVLLVSTLNNLVTPASEIGINNEMSYIIDSEGVKHAKITTDMLSCTEYRAFWVSWHKDGMLFGKGATVNQHTVVKYTHDNIHMVVAMTLASAIGNETTTATWDIYRLRGNVMYETAKAGQGFTGVRIYPPDRSWFTVQGRVRTCEEARVQLITSDSLTSYQLLLVYGSEGNTKSEIIMGEKSKDSAETPYLMNNKVDVPIWTHWLLQRLKAGLWTYPNLQLLDFKNDYNSKIDYIGFSAGENCDAHWAIDMRGGDKLVLQTPNTFFKGTTTLSMLDVNHLFLKIQAKHAAHIALSVIPNNLKTLTYEIVIQELLSGKTCLRQGVGGKQITCLKVDDLLDEYEFRDFWITWDNMTLSFGKGWDPSEATRIIYITDNLLPPFALVSFATYATKDAYWEVQLLNGTKDDDGTTTTSTTTTSTTSQQPSGSTSTMTPMSTNTQWSTKTNTGNTPTATTTRGPGGSSSATTSGSSTTTGGEGLTDPGGLSSGAIVGIVFGVLFGVIVLAFLCLAFFRRVKPDAKLPSLPSIRRGFQHSVRSPLNGGGLFPNPSYQDVVNGQEDLELEENDKGEYGGSADA